MSTVTAVPKKSVFKPSPEQKAIQTALAKGTRHLEVRARAGVGKTTTMVHGMSKVPKSYTGTMVAFNKHNAVDIQEKLSAMGVQNVTGSTWNSFGWRAYRQWKSNAQIDAHKLTRIVTDTVDDERKIKFLGGPIERTVRLLKNYLLEPTELNIDLVVDKHGFDWSPYTVDQMKEFIPDVMDSCLKETTAVDFDDQMWMTVKLNLPIPQFDFMVIDEAQDSTALQKELAMRAVPSGRIILVGDPAQAIFSFRGSSIHSMQELTASFSQTTRGLETLPLTVTRRCPKSHVQLVQSLVPDIQAMPNAPEGVIESVDPEKVLETLQPGDMVLCRTNAPLVGTCYRLIRRGVKATVRGRDIGNGLKSLMRKAKTAVTAAELLVEVERYADKEMEKFRALGMRGENRLAALQDKLDCLTEVSDGCATVLDVEKRIDMVFSDFDENGQPKHAVVLSTVHRCVHPDTLVETCKGLVPIKTLNPTAGCIATPTGPSQYEGKYIKPLGKTYKFTTKRGYQLETSPDHGMTVWKDGEHRRIEAEQIQVGDWLRLKLGHTFNPDVPDLPKAPGHLDVRAVSYRFPRRMNTELAEMLGLLVADGSVYKSGFRVIKRYQSVIDRFAQLASSLFGCEVKTGLNYETRETHIRVPRGEVHSVQIAKWLLSLGGLTPKQKDVPDLILQSSLECQRAFLRGLFEDGTINRRDDLIDHLHWDNVNPTCVKKVQTMLLRLGIASSIKIRPRVSTLYIYSAFAKRFADIIGFISSEKNEILLNGMFRPDTAHLLPVTYAEAKMLRPLLSKSNGDNALWRRYVSRHTAMECLKKRPDLQFLIDRLQWIYQPVKSIEPGESETICVSVPEGDRFLQNGFDGWNTKGLEANHVTVLNPELIPFPKVKTDLDKEAEGNLAYVAGTRGKYDMDPKGKLLKDSTLTFAGAIPSIYNRPQNVEVK